jgi:Lhr-like helicase
VRTGDTPQRERARFARHPAEILITTPESLYLLLTSQASEALRTVDTVIIDEIHALVPTKRGAHLALSLERLEALTKRRCSASASPPRSGRSKKWRASWAAWKCRDQGTSLQGRSAGSGDRQDREHPK